MSYLKPASKTDQVNVCFNYFLWHFFSSKNYLGYPTGNSEKWSFFESEFNEKK